MKNRMLIIALVLAPFFTSFAQSPIIVDFRKVIADAPSDFSNLQGERFQENDGFTFYHSTIEASPISTVYIQKHITDATLYVVDYNVSKMSTQMLGLFMNMVSQYLDELNAMVKTGQYTGEDYTDGAGNSVTELKTLDNNLAFQYVSNDTHHYLYFFGNPR